MSGSLKTLASFDRQNCLDKVNHARILMKADTNSLDGGWTEEAISIALDISIPTIERVRLFVEQGLETQYIEEDE